MPGSNGALGGPVHCGPLPVRQPNRRIKERDKKGGGGEHTGEREDEEGQREEEKKLLLGTNLGHKVVMEAYKDILGKVTMSFVTTFLPVSNWLQT